MTALRDHVAQWLLRRRGTESPPIRLTQGRIYILPTGGGVLLGATLLTMLMGCINYSLGLGYVFTFLLSGVGLVCLLHTFRNLAQLEIRPGRAEPVFAGAEASFSLLIDNPTSLARLSVVLQPIHKGSGELPLVRCDPVPGGQTRCDVRLPTHQRGRLRLPRLRVFTTYPLGLFHAWSYVDLDMTCVVYPRPESGQPALPPPRGGEGESLAAGGGQDDFAGLRRYQPGDSLRHVAWKAVAHGQPVMTKQFTGLEAGELWFSWWELAAELQLEAKLSRLTRWVLEARRQGLSFGLELPGARIPVEAGAAHEERCLTALALFRAP